MPYSLLKENDSSMERLRRKKKSSSRFNGIFNKNLNMNGEFIVVWLDNSLIEVSPMPTNRRRMNLQTRDMSSPLTY